MDKILSENLFLLEFLVDKVDLKPGAVPKEIADVAGETCVSFRFLDNDPLDVCEEDFNPSRNYANDTGIVRVYTEFDKVGIIVTSQKRDINVKIRTYIFFCQT